MVTEEEYQKGLEALSSLISGKVRSDGKNWSHAFDMMKIYLERLDLEERLSKLSVIHVAGTKGKGSTCAMVERILRQAGYKTGLYTSPHLIDVRERIRINGKPVDKEKFLRHLWRCYNILEDKADEEAGRPAYFRFLTLLGFEIFLDSDVDVVILEVGLGGRLDATNCIKTPQVTGITSLGFDHVELLGHTLPLIATEKAGIFKTGRPAYTVTQPEDALEALKVVAQRVEAPLQVTPPLDQYTLADGSKVQDLKLGLPGEHQRLNASLAVVLAAEWEAHSEVAFARQGQAARDRGVSVLEGSRLPEEYAQGLAAATWPGRGQIVHDGVPAEDDIADSGATSTPAAAMDVRREEPRIPPPRLSFYLDGAHTPESMAECARWFADTVHGAPAVTGLTTQRVLLFNCMEERDPDALLAPLARILAQKEAMPHSVLFVPPESVYARLGPADAPPDLQWQHALRGTWERIAAPQAAPRPVQLPALPAMRGLVQDASRGAVLPNLQVTLDWLRRCVGETPALRLQVLVSGSLYLVGDMLRLLGRTA